MKRYETYKDSGAEWIGEIPESWKGVNLKWISNITKGKKPKVDFDENGENLLPYLSMEFLRGKTSNPTYASIEEKGLVHIDDGDILILWDGSKAGEIVKAKKGILSSTMAKIEINDNNFESNYLNYLLKLGERHVQQHTIGMGIPHVSGDILKMLPMLVPSPKEQTQIAAYLDHKTGLIDSIIAQKEALIKKLKEQRQTIINEAVTKGLNPDVKLKDSGIEWLGEIPEHWEVVKLKYLVNHSTAKGNGNSELKIALENIESGTGRLLRNDEKEFEGDLKIFEKDDILFNKLRPYLSKVLIAPEDGECVSELLVFKARQKKVFYKFLFHRLSSEQIISIVDSSTYGAKMPRASIDFILELPIPVPDIIEQETISDFINKNQRKIDISSNKLKLSIQKLKEYRQSLISEAVTGKIDVRNWQAPKS